LIDFHNHLLAGVDDGATTVEEGLAALSAMVESGVRTLVATPHLRAALATDPAALDETLDSFAAAANDLRQAATAAGLDVRIEVGAEIMLDTPQLELLADERVRLAGTPFVLVEFPGLLIPRHGVQALYQIRLAGWRPIIGHPERYHNLDSFEVIEEWRNIGCFLQVNHGSVAGRYGKQAQSRAWTLLEEGWADYLSSDYHTRGTPSIDRCRHSLSEAGGAEQFRILTEVNPQLMLEGADPEAVAPLERSTSLWRRLISRFR
jgi:protein-tyrosine phosphatase